MSDVDHWVRVVEDLRSRLAGERTREADLLERKRAVALPALTGDNRKGRLLTEYNKEFSRCCAAILDLEAAIDAATAKLEEAEAAARQAEEVERLKRLRDLAEQRVALAPKIEEAAAALGELLDRNEQLARQMAAERHLDAGHHRRCSAGAEIRVALGEYLGPYIESGRSDPRHGQPLAELTSQKLSVPVVGRGARAGRERAGPRFRTGDRGGGPT